MNDLKLFAKCYVEVHDLTVHDKKKLFEYIDLAKDCEVMNLLITGSAVTLPEEQQNTVVESFKQTMAYPIILLGEQITSVRQVVKEKDLDSLLILSSRINPHVPDIVTKFFWNAAQKVTGKHPFTSIKGVELWLSRADAEQVASMTSKLTHGATVGAATLAAVFLFLSVKFLMSKLSAASRACKKLPKHKRAECIKKYKTDAIKSQISILQKGLTACANTTKPDKCKRTLQKRIEKLKKKLQKIK